MQPTTPLEEKIKTIIKNKLIELLRQPPQQQRQQQQQQQQKQQRQQQQQSSLRQNRHLQEWRSSSLSPFDDNDMAIAIQNSLLDQQPQPPSQNILSFAPVSTVITRTRTGIYPFLSVPIINKKVYCYQNAAFQFLFSMSSIKDIACIFRASGDIDIVVNNAMTVLKSMCTNMNTTHAPIRQIQSQDALAGRLFRITDRQEDASEFLRQILDRFCEYFPSIQESVTLSYATYSFCRGISPSIAEKNMNELQETYSKFENSQLADVLKTVMVETSKGFKEIYFITSEARRKFMDIPSERYASDGTLIGINPIQNEILFSCEPDETHNSLSIEETLNASSRMSNGSRILDIVSGTQENLQEQKIIRTAWYDRGDYSKNDELYLCPSVITQKRFFKIPEGLQYMCIHKGLLEGAERTTTFSKYKNLNVNGVQFKLRGYISHMGRLTYHAGQPSAQSGHYVYVGIEDEAQVLYNDGQEPQRLRDDYNELINRGCIFLYERVKVSSSSALLSASATVASPSSSAQFSTPPSLLSALPSAPAPVAPAPYSAETDKKKFESIVNDILLPFIEKQFEDFIVETDKPFKPTEHFLRKMMFISDKDLPRGIRSLLTSGGSYHYRLGDLFEKEGKEYMLAISLTSKSFQLGFFSGNHRTDNVLNSIGFSDSKRRQMYIYGIKANHDDGPRIQGRVFNKATLDICKAMHVTRLFISDHAGIGCFWDSKIELEHFSILRAIIGEPTYYENEFKDGHFYEPEKAKSEKKLLQETKEITSDEREFVKEYFKSLKNQSDKVGDTDGCKELNRIIEKAIGILGGRLDDIAITKYVVTPFKLSKFEDASGGDKKNKRKSRRKKI